MLSNLKEKILILMIPVVLFSAECAAKGADEQCRDPISGNIVYTDECMQRMGFSSEASKYAFPAPEPAESEKIKSIESRGNDIIFKFGDGSEKVFISDPFHPERGYKPKY